MLQSSESKRVGLGHVRFQLGFELLKPVAAAARGDRMGRLPGGLIDDTQNALIEVLSWCK